MKANKRGPYTIKKAPRVEPNYRPDGTIRSWSVRVTVNYREVRKTFPTKEDAETFSETILSERFDRIIANQNSVKVPLRTLIEKWFDHSVDMNTSTKRIYRGATKHISPGLGSLFAHDFTESHLRDLLGEIIKKKSPSVANIIMVVFKRALNWGAIQYKFEAPPLDWKGLYNKFWTESEEEIHFLTPAEINTVVKAAHDAAEKGELPPFVPYAVELVLMTGIRSGELLGLKIENIDLKRGKLYIRNTIASQEKGGAYLKNGTKSGEEEHRVLPLNETAKNAIKKLFELREEYQKKFHTETPFLITRTKYSCNQMKGFVSSSTWWRQISKLGEILDRNGIVLTHCIVLKPHVFRHTFATTYLMHTKGEFRAALLALQKFMGHSKIETTMRYLHVIESESENSIAALDSLLSR